LENHSWYVYVYEDDRGVIYYVGMGQGGRAYAHVVDGREKVTVRIIWRDMTKEQAQMAEAWLIQEFTPFQNVRQPKAKPIRPKPYVEQSPALSMVGSGDIQVELSGNDDDDIDLD
jgi:hypothetical protein